MDLRLLAAIDAQCRLFLLHTNPKDREQDIASLYKLTKEYMDKTQPQAASIQPAAIIMPKGSFGG